jgi:hypothetical protein
VTELSSEAGCAMPRRKSAIARRASSTCRVAGAGTHALGLCGCETGADHVDKKFDGEPMRQHDRLSAASCWRPI